MRKQIIGTQALSDTHKVLRSPRINLLLLALPFTLAVFMPAAGLPQGSPKTGQ